MMLTTLQYAWYYFAILWQEMHLHKGPGQGKCIKRGMRSRWEGYSAWSCPQATVRSSLLASTRFEQIWITAGQGREWERGKGGGRNLGVGSQRAGLCDFLLASGCVSHLTSSLSVTSSQMRGQEGGGEGGTLAQPCLCIFTKYTELGLKLKQGKTRKRSAASRSPSFSQFPV